MTAGRGEQPAVLAECSSFATQRHPTATHDYATLPPMPLLPYHPHHRWLQFALLGALALASVAVSLMLGSVPIDPRTVVQALSGTAASLETTVVLELRLP